MAARPIDWEAVLERYGGRQAFVEKLIDMALESQAQTPAALREIAAREDLEALAFTAHSLKGLAGNLKAGRLLDMAKRVEDAARQGKAKALAHAGPLADAVEEFLDAMRAWRSAGHRDPDRA